VTTTAVIPIAQLGAKYRALAKKFPAAVKRAFVSEAMRLVVCVNAEVARTTPHPPHGVTNLYAAGWRFRRRHDGAVVFNMTPQSVWIERGRNAGPVSEEGYEALKRWVELKRLHTGVLASMVPRARAKHIVGYLEESGSGARGAQGLALGRFRRRVRKDANEMAIEHVATAIREAITRHGYHARFPLWRAIQSWAPGVAAAIERELAETAK